MTATYLQRGSRVYPAGEPLGVELPSVGIRLEHVQASLEPGSSRFWVGWSPVRGRWLKVHESRLVFETDSPEVRAKKEAAA